MLSHYVFNVHQSQLSREQQAKKAIAQHTQRHRNDTQKTFPIISVTTNIAIF